MFYFYDALRLVVRMTVRFTNDRMEDGFYWEIERCNGYVERDGDFSMPLQTADLRLTSIIATGYEYDTEAWSEDLHEAVTGWLYTWAGGW